MSPEFVYDIINLPKAIQDIISEYYIFIKLEREFLGKRARLAGLLQAEGYKVPLGAAMSPDYDQGFDEFLYQEVGYPLLTSLTMGLFISPYGITSLREYFANAYEHYFLGEQKRVRTLSPQAYKKIEKLINYEHNL